MTVFNPAGTSGQAVINTAKDRLLALRDAMKGVQSFGTWLAGQTAADLAALNMDPADITILVSAFTDMNTLFSIAGGGPLPAQPQAFMANSTLVIGPQ